jgi:hypothetical protein
MHGLSDNVALAAFLGIACVVPQASIVASLDILAPSKTLMSSSVAFLSSSSRASVRTTSTERLFHVRDVADGTQYHPRPITRLCGQSQDRIQDEANKIHSDTTNNLSTTTNIAGKASWYAVEWFGKVMGGRPDGSRQGTQQDRMNYYLDQPPKSIQETFMRIQQDNERSYFLSGQVDALVYDIDCVFADPFVSFQGRDRFVQNLQNLGSFVTQYNARPLDYQVRNSNDDDLPSVTTKFMVKLQLNLPWKPVLAWPWGVQCRIDPKTFLVVRHEETWDIDAWEVRVSDGYANLMIVSIDGAQL